MQLTGQFWSDPTDVEFEEFYCTRESEIDQFIIFQEKESEKSFFSETFSRKRDNFSMIFILQKPNIFHKKFIPLLSVYIFQRTPVLDSDECPRCVYNDHDIIV